MCVLVANHCCSGILVREVLKKSLQGTRRWSCIIDRWLTEKRKAAKGTDAALLRTFCFVAVLFQSVSQSCPPLASQRRWRSHVTQTARRKGSTCQPASQATILCSPLQATALLFLRSSYFVYIQRQGHQH